MRDRRNTSSASSSDSSSALSPRTGPARKDCKAPLEHGTLPPPATKENRPRSISRPALACRILSALFVAAILLRLAWRWSSSRPLALSSPTLHALLEPGRRIDLPTEPAPVTFTDAGGRSRWTVSIPRNASFPLPARHYRDMCSRWERVREPLLEQSNLARSRTWRGAHSYYARDPSYLDVREAQESGVLPPDRVSYPSDVCDTSMTFALESEHASFGKSLLLLWLSYGLAKHEGRAFFIDDSRWPYGTYTSYFPPPPDPGCRAPPPSHVVPCPHEARHIVVSAATARWTFGTAFDAHFGSKPTRFSLGRAPDVFDMTRIGHDALFRIIGDDAAYASQRADELRSDADARNAPLLGLQIRRGDLHPHELQFSRDYLPLERYATAARRLLDALGPSSTAHDAAADSSIPHDPPALILASDDPDLVSSPELTQAAAPLVIRTAQDRIQLATKAALDRDSPAMPQRAPGSAYVKHVDENAGWDGGFYPALFFSLGGGASDERSSPASDRGGADAATPRGSVSDHAMRVRQLVARGYLLDLAVLARADAVVCAVSGAACRLLAVMLGRRAVEAGRWVNVDDGRAWSWDGRR